MTQISWFKCNDFFLIWNKICLKFTFFLSNILTFIFGDQCLINICYLEKKIGLSCLVWHENFQNEQVATVDDLIVKYLLQAQVHKKTKFLFLICFLIRVCSLKVFSFHLLSLSSTFLSIILSKFFNNISFFFFAHLPIIFRLINFATLSLFFASRVISLVLQLNSSTR